jgi:hypothetical protein
MPFLLYLLYRQEFGSASLLLLLSIGLSKSKYKSTLSYTIPTPFYKYPFEFTVGFRNSMFMLFVSFTLSIISIIVANLNLGLFSIALLLLTIISYYTIVEDEYFVWSYRYNPLHFLLHKLKTAWILTTIICSPSILLMCWFYSNDITSILILYGVGRVFIASILLAKYASFPSEINLPIGFLIVFCMTFPPLLLAVIPYLFLKATSNLKQYLK